MLSNYFADLLAEAALGGDALVVPATLELHLLVAQPDPSSQILSEIGSGVGYVPPSFDNDASTWGTVLAGRKTNIIPFEFGTSTATWPATWGLAAWDPAGSRWLWADPWRDSNGTIVPQPAIPAGLTFRLPEGFVRVFARARG